MIENVFYMKIERKKIIKFLPKKSFSVFGGSHVRPPNTLKLFFDKMFYKYFLTLMKNAFFVISRFFLQKKIGII